jgi:hypothetical protein
MPVLRRPVEPAVKTGKTRYEQMFSALALITDIARPAQPVHSCRKKVGSLLFDHVVGAGAFVPATFAMWQRLRDFLPRVS